MTTLPRIILRHTLRLLAALTILWTSTVPVSAQSDPLLSQYWAVPTFYNPGAIGTTDYIRLRGAGRLQWIGIENAPKNVLIVADSPFKLFGKRMGAGISFNNERLGLFTNMLVAGQLGTNFKLFKGRLSVGVQVAYYNSRFKGTEVTLPDGDDFHESNDPAIPTEDISGNAADFSVGLWYSHKYFDVGISGMHLLQPKVKLFKEGDTQSESHNFETELRRTVYFTGSSNIELKNTLFTLQPSILLLTDFSTFTGEITMRATYNRFLYGGVGYRWNDAVSIMLGAEFKNIFVGYAYDIPVTAIGHGSSGSHELVAGFRFKLDFSGKNKNKHRSIRIM